MKLSSLLVRLPHERAAFSLAICEGRRACQAGVKSVWIPSAMEAGEIACVTIPVCGRPMLCAKSPTGVLTIGKSK